MQKELIDKYLEETATKEEREEVEFWYSAIQIPYEQNRSEDDVRVSIYNKINKAIALYPVRKFKLTKKIIAIAAAILLIGIPLVLTIKNKNDRDNRDQMAFNIMPGGSKAILTLSDGEQVDLSDTAKRWKSELDALKITNKNGKITYPLSYRNAVNGQYNTLSTNRGGTYEVMLPDGTHVWLNASSSIRYPETFGQQPRHVELTGEAYFEVAASRDVRNRSLIPFIIHAGEEKIEVLGTQFNVRHYPLEEDRTTLIEGKVKVSKNGQSEMLHPGEAVVSADEGSRLRKIAQVNTEAAVAWKNGMFYFEQASVPEILRAIGQWYDIDVYYEGKTPLERFSGKVSRQERLSEVLKILESGGIHFTLKDKKLIVH